MQTVKRRFFAMRNGVIADTMRRAGSPFNVVFGLNLPQLVEIAAEIKAGEHAGQLAAALWANRTCRESMLLAPMLFDAAALPRSQAGTMMREAPCAEVADVLCHRLLRHTPYARDLAHELSDDSDDMVRYAALRLMFNIVSTCPADAKAMARKELDRGCSRTRAIAANLLEEAEFLTETL